MEFGALWLIPPDHQAKATDSKVFASFAATYARPRAVNPEAIPPVNARGVPFAAGPDAP